MGLKNGLGKRTYLTIREGKIAKNIGDKKYELYDSFEGVIVGMSTKDGMYGQELCLDLKDGGEVYQLQLRIKGEDKPGQLAKQTSHFIAFAHCCPIIDPTKPVEFIPSLKIVDEKKRAALFLKQNGETLKWAFKKGEGMPDPEEVFNKKGELVSIDWSEVETFRMNKVNEFSAKVKEAASFNNMMASEVVQDSSDDLTPLEDDDLPF
jgi:hypothetical protein